jgi:Gpi18-like mannosyltransferase
LRLPATFTRERYFPPQPTDWGMRNSSSNRSKRLEYLSLAALALVALAVRLLLFPVQGYKNDVDIFVQWLRTAADGVPGFYERGFCDYPPLNVYIFWAFGSLARSLSLFGTDFVTYVVKLIPSLFDVATVCLIFVFVRDRLSFKASIAAAAVYAFNPAVIFNSAVWGQFDSIYTFLLLVSFMLILRGRWTYAVVVFTLAVLTKPQSVALAPLMAYLVYRKQGLCRTLASTLIIAATTLIVVLPIRWGDPVAFLLDLYFGGYRMYHYTSVNAFNIWGIFGFWKPDTTGVLFLTPFLAGWVLFAVATFLSLYLLDKQLKTWGDLFIFFTAFILLFCFFMLPTRIHERYIFPSLGFLALLLPFWGRLRLVYVSLTTTLFVNLAYAMVTLNAHTPIPDGDPIVICVSLVNTLVFVYSLVLFLRGMDGSVPTLNDVD